MPAGPSSDAGGPSSDAGNGSGDAGFPGADAGSTFDAVELVRGENFVAVAVEPADDGFLLAWIEERPASFSLSAVRLDASGARVNLDQQLHEVPFGGATRLAALAPGAFRRLDGARWRLTATMGHSLVVAVVDRFGFRQGPVDVFQMPEAAWALEREGGSFVERDGAGDTWFRSTTGVRSLAPPTQFRGKAVGARSGVEVQLLTTNQTGAVALEASAVPGLTWNATPIAQAPTPVNALAPWAEPLALRPSGTGWLAVWAEGNPNNPRQLNVRLRRAGSPTVVIEDEAAWYRTTADVVEFDSRWALAWVAISGGYNGQVRFQREGGAAAPCALQLGQTDASAGPVALAVRPEGRIGALWVEPITPASSAVRKSRLVFRSLGTQFCLP